MIMRTVIWSLMLAGFAAAALAGPVTVREPSVCYSCHTDIQDLGGKKFQHTAFASGKCSSCHNPHASRHAGLLTDDSRTLCLTCHADIAAEIHRTVGHQPALNGDCGACHDPHAGDLKNQLSQKVPALCESCHDNVKTWLARPVVHRPAATGNCQACHATHGADQQRLLARPVPELCFSCHKQDAAMTAAHRGFDLTRADCGTCHDPHSSSLASLLMPNQHAPFKGGKCATCHSTAGGSGLALTTDVKTLCTKCHPGVLKEASTAHQHNLNDERSCLNCHNAHAASGGSLLAADQKDLCFRCHFKGDNYKGKKTEYLTHDGMECSNCHVAHGSDNAGYVKTTGLELCTGCHADAHKGSHPVGEGVIDPRTKAQMTCLSCHQLHGPAYKPYLPLDPTQQLCLQCHRK